MQTLDIGILLIWYMLAACVTGSVTRIGYASRRNLDINISYSVAGAIISWFLYLNMFQLIGAWTLYWGEGVVFNPIFTFIMALLVAMSFTSAYGMTMLFGDFHEGIDRWREKRILQKLTFKSSLQPLSPEEIIVLNKHKPSSET